MSIYIQLLSTPAGDLLLGEYQQKLCLCDWMARRNRQTFDQRMISRLKTSYEVKNTPLLSQTSEELQEYFLGERLEFDIPIILHGTDFQQKVWQALETIAYGQTTYYQQLAKAIAKPTAVRAVANAIGANPVSILIPCHRVIGKNKQLTGYAGGIGAKKTLLNLEYHARELKTPLL